MCSGFCRGGFQIAVVSAALDAGRASAQRALFRGGRRLCLNKPLFVVAEVTYPQSGVVEPWFDAERQLCGPERQVEVLFLRAGYGECCHASKSCSNRPCVSVLYVCQAAL